MVLHGAGPTCCVEAPGKLNLFLEVLGKRSDGFHEIETLMAAISRYDTLYFEATGEGDLRLTCKWASGMEASQALHGNDAVTGWGALPDAEENLVWKALARVRQEAGKRVGMRVRIVKRIPAAAGLGGGSSDAAAALLAANHLWGLQWDRARLAAVAAELGSDVPFFLPPAAPAATALCRGRGEQITAGPASPPLHVVVVRPWDGMSTAAVYQHCQPAERPVAVQPLWEALQRGRPAEIGRLLFNRLEPAAAALGEYIRRTRAQLARLDLPGFAMSGSGSSFFAICHHRRHALRVAARLRAARIGLVFAATTSPLRCRLAAEPA